MKEEDDAADGEEVEAAAAEENGEQPKPAVSNDFENLDDTPNLRTVLANSEDEPTDYRTILVDIEQLTIAGLTQKLMAEFGQTVTSRIRNLTTEKLYTKGDEDTLLKEFE